MLIQIDSQVTREPQSVGFPVRKVLFVTNDGQEDLLFNLDTLADRGSGFGIVLKAGETVGPLDLSINKINFFTLEQGKTTTLRAGGIRHGAY